MSDLGSEPVTGSAPTVVVIRRGRERARTVAWRGDRATALLTAAPEAPLLSVDFVRHCLSTLAGQGFSRVVTGALSPLEQAGFIAAGFAVEEDLCLLGMDLTPSLPPVPRGARLARVPSWRRADVLRVDLAAFGDFWCFDQVAVADALGATPSARIRAARPRGQPLAGYVICGRARGRGYVQRLAVHPDAQRRGIGRRLLLDGLHWMARHGATRAVVNTQVGNRAALSLYAGVGFDEEPFGLSVLSAGLR